MATAQPVESPVSGPPQYPREAEAKAYIRNLKYEATVPLIYLGGAVGTGVGWIVGPTWGLAGLLIGLFVTLMGAAIFHAASD